VGYDTEEELRLFNYLCHYDFGFTRTFSSLCMKLGKKEKVEGKLHRKNDREKTHYQRLLESGKLSQEVQKSLQELT